MFSCNDKFNRHYELSEAIYKQKKTTDEVLTSPVLLREIILIAFVNLIIFY